MIKIDYPLSKIKNQIKKLLDKDAETIPEEYWHEYEDCYCKIVQMGEDMHDVGVLVNNIVYPIVVLVAKATGGVPCGHKLTFAENDPDYSHVYFLAGNGELTRDVSKAKVYWLKKENGVPIYRFIEDKPKGYKAISIQYVWKAQETIDSKYPLPRKAITKKERELTYQKFNGHCAYCGKPITMKEMQVDHIKSHMNNCGKDDIDNYYPACATCNRIKSDLTIEEFRQRITRCGQVHRGRKKPIMADYDEMAINYGIDKEDKPVIFYFEKKGD